MIANIIEHNDELPDGVSEDLILLVDPERLPSRNGTTIGMGSGVLVEEERPSDPCELYFHVKKTSNSAPWLLKWSCGVDGKFVVTIDELDDNLGDESLLSATEQTASSAESQ